MSVHDRKNLKSALESAILYLQKQGVEEARQDAWLLLEHVCGISHSTYFVHSEDEMPKEQQEQYEALVRKRGGHIHMVVKIGAAIVVVRVKGMEPTGILHIRVFPLFFGL